MTYHSPRRRRFGLGADLMAPTLAPRLTASPAITTAAGPAAASGPVMAPNALQAQGVVSPASALIGPVASRLARMATAPAAITEAQVRQMALDIVPESCRALDMSTLGASQGTAPGQVAVMAWPLVKLDEAAVQRVLDGIYGGGAGGEAVLRAIAVSSGVLPDGASQDEINARAAIGSATIAQPPNFVASGWMPDPLAARTGPPSRGTLWVAFGWPIAVSARSARNFALRVLSPLTGIPVSAAGSASEGFTASSPMGIGGIPKVSDGTGDLDLQNAAVRSATAAIAGILAIGAGLFGVGPLAKASAATQTTRSFNSNLTKLTDALTALGSVPSLVSQSDMVSEAARLAEPDTCRVAIAAVDANIATLSRAKSTIIAARDVPQQIMRYVRTETNPDASDFVKEIRDQVVAAVNEAQPPGSGLAVTRNYLTCLTWKTAKRSLDAQILNMTTKLAEAESKAVALSSMGDAISVALAAIDAAILTGQQAKEQSCLSWFEKDAFGVPRYFWFGGGIASFLMVAVAVKASRKKKADAAKAKSASAPVTPNGPRRRRTSIRTLGGGSK